MYGCSSYLPLYVFCGRHLLVARLHCSDIGASAGAVEEVVHETLIAWCDTHRVDYLHSQLVDALSIDRAWAEEKLEKTGKPARRSRVRAA